MELLKLLFVKMWTYRFYCKVMHFSEIIANVNLACITYLLPFYVSITSFTNALVGEP